MANRPSDSLRQQFEEAKRAAELHGTLTSLHEVRAKVVMALGCVREHLDPIEAAAERKEVAWLLGTYRDWKAEQRYLREEPRQLEELRDEVDSFIHP